MAHEKRFKDLLAEFQRVGVDPNTFSAVLAVNPEDALRALRALPDGAGPTAFLAEVRRVTRAEGRPSPAGGVSTSGGVSASGGGAVSGGDDTRNDDRP